MTSPSPDPNNEGRYAGAAGSGGSRVNAVVGDLVEHRSILPTDLGLAMAEIMDGEVAPESIAALLIGLRMKGETVDEIVEVAKALRARATTAQVRDPRAIDTCGTGGSGIDTFNISTTAAFVVAGAGVSVAKHGNRAASSRSGSFDVLEKLGIRIDLPIAAYADILNDIGIAPFFARTAHPAYRHVAPVRAALRVRTLLNCLGPLLSPVGARFQVVGVYSENLITPLAGALGKLGTARALVVHGGDGMDELTTTTTSRATLVDQGKTEELVIDPTELGLERSDLSELVGAGPEENASTTRRILAGEKGRRRDIVLLNAAAALWVAEAATSLENGIQLAARSIDGGAAEEKLRLLAEATREAGRRADAAADTRVDSGTATP